MKDLFNLYVWAFCLYGGISTTWGLLAMWPEKTIRCPGTEVQVTMWMLWSWPGFSTERQVLLTGPIVSSLILLRMCYFRQFIIAAEPRLCTHPLRAILSLSLVSLITRLVTELNHLCAIYVLCADASVLSGLCRVDTGRSHSETGSLSWEDAHTRLVSRQTCDAFAAFSRLIDVGGSSSLWVVPPLSWWPLAL